MKIFSNIPYHIYGLFIILLVYVIIGYQYFKRVVIGKNKSNEAYH
jgi:hypothetical protein